MWAYYMIQKSDRSVINISFLILRNFKNQMKWNCIISSVGIYDVKQ